MTTTAAAIALREQADVLAGSISSLFALCGDNSDADATGKIVSTIGRVDALRFARTQDAFEAAFEFLATRRFYAEFARLVADEHVQALVRRAMACDIAGHGSAVRNEKAAEYGNDLAERYELLVKLVTRLAPQGGPPSEALEACAAWIAAVTGLRLASYSPEQWPDWMIGMLWNFGRRGLVEIARAAGATWEAAVDELTTKRDKALSAQPFDGTASDEAARLLGLQ